LLHVTGFYLTYSVDASEKNCIKGNSNISDGSGRSSRSAQGSRTPERPASSLQSVSSLLLGDPELPPFSVDPGIGVINPGASQTFHIRFSPLEVAEFEARLICRSDSCIYRHVECIIFLSDLMNS